MSKKKQPRKAKTPKHKTAAPIGTGAAAVLPSSTNSVSGAPTPVGAPVMPMEVFYNRMALEEDRGIEGIE